LDIIKEIVDFWINSYRQSKKLFWVDTVGTVTSVLASLAMAVGSPMPNMLFVFSFYLVGSLCLQYTTFKRGASWLFTLMTWYTLMNLIGLYNLI